MFKVSSTPSITRTILVMLAFALCISPSSHANLSGDVKVVCFGDSVTGVYYHTGGRRAYTDMVEIGLKQLYPDATITAINAGISGHTTVNALSRIQKDVLDHKPDVVTVKFGLNDMTRVSLDDYRANLKTIVTMCREIEAEVILCTPNSVLDTVGRPTAKLEQYAAVVREVAKEMETPLADCYEAFQAIRAKNSLDWSFLMSDAIHPNMDGHKVIAETIVKTIAGKSVSLKNEPSPQPAIPHTLKLIANKKPIKVLAMTPYDTIIAEVLKEVAPDSTITVTPWVVGGKTLAEIETASKVNVRGKGYDFVVLAVPAEASAETPEAFIQSYSWVLNFSLSFGYQEWDVIALPPSLLAKRSGDNATRSAWAKRLILAQDFELIDSMDGSSDVVKSTIKAWIVDLISRPIEQ